MSAMARVLCLLCLADTAMGNVHHHGHKHHRHNHHSSANGSLPWVLAHRSATTAPGGTATGPVSNVPGVEEVHQAAANASEAFRSAKDASTAANAIAVHSLKVTSRARDDLDDARAALHDARAESQGLSWEQREFLRQAEARLREATQEAEVGKLKQAKYVFPEDHGTRYTVGKESYLRNLEHQLAANPKGITDGEGGMKGEEARLHRELFTLRRQLESKKRDATKHGIKYAHAGSNPDLVDDKPVDQMLEEIDRLDEMLGKLEKAPKGAESQDEVKAEIERLRDSIHHLEVRALTESELVERQLKGLTELKAVLMEIAEVEKKLAATGDSDAKFKESLEKDLAGLNSAAKVLEEDLAIQPAEVDALLSRLGREVGEAKVTMPDAPPTTTTPVPSLSYEIPEKRQIIGRIRELAMEQHGSQVTAAGRGARFARLDESGDGVGKVADASSSSIDIDTAMPYGELEPFGREDTAQELTEASIRESDSMVDQIERAEVSEEKRSVFRALTRLRGAAITSFDGVARSQTGNIDEYNKVHQWRSTHPLHHLADEESDISKWAFPEDADF